MQDVKRIAIVIVIGLALLTQLVDPIPAYADGETPLPTDSPTETSTAEPTAAPTELSPTESSTPEASATPPAPAETEPTSATDTPVDTSTESITPDTSATTPAPTETEPSISTPIDSVTSTLDPVETCLPDPTPQDTPLPTDTPMPTDLVTPTMESVAKGTSDVTQENTLVATETPIPTESATEVLPSETLTLDALTPTPTEASIPTPTDAIAPTVSDFETKTPGSEPLTSTPEPTLSTPEPIETSPSTDIITTDQSTLLETVQAVSSDAGIVVLGENGQPEPLVTQDAAQAIVNGDPMWCPDGVMPGGPGCTVNYGSMGDLLTQEGGYINGQNVNGTIWITAGTFTEPGPVLIDGNTYTNWSNYSLTLQGGWCGSSGISLCGSSVFSVPFTISNWNDNVAVSLVDVQNGDLKVENINGNVDLRYVNSFNGPTSSDGNVVLSNINGNVNLNNVNAPKIKISDSTMTNGSRITLTGVGADVDIKNVNVSNAAGSALGITVDGTHNVNITDSHFIDNHVSNNVPYPWGDGVDIFSNNGTVNVTVANSEFSGNDWGLWVTVGNLISITNSLFDRNNVDIAVGCASGNGIGLTFPDLFSINVDVNPDCTYAITTPPAPTPTPPGPTPPGPTPTLAPTLPPDFIPTAVALNSNNADIRDVVVVNSSSNLKYKEGKAEFFLDCDLHQKIFKIYLPNGDKVDIYCEVSGKARITRVDNTTLPQELPAGYTFASAFQVDILQPVTPLKREPTGDYVRKPIPVITEGGHITASFVATPLQPGKTFSILYWDESTSQWIPLQDFLSGRSFSLFPDNPDEKRKILSGVIRRDNNDPARMDVSTNFPGIFVLAQY